MDELCRKLRAARERAGLSIEEMAARTKIGAAKLAALESGDFARLPGEFYTRAFLRTYAREVLLSPDDVVREYEAARTPAQPLAVPAVDEETLIGEAAYTQPTAFVPVVRKSNLWAGLAFLGLVVMVIVSVWRQAAPTRAEETGVVATSGVAAHHEADPVPTPAGTSGRAEATVPPGQIRIEITPNAEVWVTATADGERKLYRLLKPGEHVTVDARKQLALRVGNAGAFDYSINGAPGKPLGGRGAVRQVTITPANAQAFLR